MGISWRSLYVALVVTVALSISCAEETYINQFAVHIEGGHNAANRVARETGLINLGQIGDLEDHYLFEAHHRERRSASPLHDHVKALSDHPEVFWHEQQVAKSRKKRDFHPRDVAEQMSVIDPYWKNQWYLHGGAQGGFDMDVLEAWREGYTGKNVVITILDDGLERDHPDLIKNYDPYASYDVNDHDSDPMPRYDPSNENRHGTRCAGEVSAEANNTACTIGIAPDSKIGGIRMLDGEVYDAVEAASLSFNRSHVDIYSASWGPDDDGKVVDGPGKLAKKAFVNGIAQGRDGKGSIFVWASGNGGSAQDSCNCDGYANSIYTLSISSTSENGVKPWYLEECSSTLATTYSSGAYNERQIASTDLRKRCTTTHTGTSASAPLAAGIVALILEANKDLTWRDVQYITLMTARPEPMRDGQWITNGVGRKVSLRYGYGLMDATAMVKLALVWNNVPTKYECTVSAGVLNAQLEGQQTFTHNLDTDGCAGQANTVKYLEHVQAHITLSYHRRGDVVLYLTSPQGTRSQILPHRPNDAKPGGFDDWPFLSVHFWGENPKGRWTLEVQDANSFNRNMGGGTLVKWSLVLHGTKSQPVRLRNETITPTPPPTTRQPITPPSRVTPKICHPECVSTCTGPKASDCYQCKHFIVGPTKECVASCPDNMYVNEQTCLPCDMTCATCSGPTLTQCLSCPPGHQYIHLKDHGSVCSVECLDGFFQSTNSCMPCDSNCWTCENSADDCTSCAKHFSLKGNVCVEEEFFPLESGNIIILIILVCLVIGVFLSAVVGVIYAWRNQYLCWSEKQFYWRLPKDDEDAVVRLTYSDDLEEELGA